MCVAAGKERVSWGLLSCKRKSSTSEIGSKKGPGNTIYLEEISAPVCLIRVVVPQENRVNTIFKLQIIPQR